MEHSDVCIILIRGLNKKKKKKIYTSATVHIYR